MAEKLRYLISLVGEETVSPAAGKARNSLKRLERDVARAATVNKKYVESGGKIQATYKDMNVGAKKFNATMSTAQDITNMSGKQYKKLEKDLDLLEKQYPGVGKRIKGYTHNIRESGIAIKEIESAQKKNTKITEAANQKQMEANKIWTAGQRTQEYTRKLISMNGAQYQKLTSRISETGDAQKIADDIRLKGHKALTPELKKGLAMRVKEIEAIQKSGVTVDANTKKQHEGIMRLNDSLKKYGTRMGTVRRGMDGMFATIKKAGLVFLTLLGPLFLVGAALRTVKQAADWVYQPFIKFEDALYELRKTANLTKEVMLDIGEAIAGLSLRIPVAAEALAKIAATAGRLGIRGRSNILAFTEAIAKMSVATVLTADEAAEALAKIRQAFNLPVENIEYLGSVINELSNTTASNSRDIVAAMRNIGAAGKMIGITADEASAMSATLVASGMAAERAGTRIRRMLTEMARKTEKMADAMELPTAEMKRAIEEDPMAALLMYLKHLSETESRIDKLKEAHEIFGKVGGFAIATLAENYPELIRNLETASHEIAWGTSLQREFQIATTKTSAELQILTNRSEAARREIGEELVPALISARTITVGFTEAIAMASAGLNEITGETDDSITAFDVYLNQWDKLNARFMTNIDASRSVTTTAREFRKELVMGPDYVRDLSLEMHGLTLTEKEEAEMEMWNNEVRRHTKGALEALYTSSKKWGDLESNQLKPMKTYNDYLVVRDKWISHIAETEDDEAERAKKIADVKKLEPILFDKAVDAMIPYMKEKEKIIPLDENETKALTKLERAQEKGFFTIEKGIRVKGEDADATLDVTKALESLEGITEEYIQDVEELTKSTKELWSGVSGLTGIYESQYDTYVKLRKMEKGMPRWIKQRIDIYDDEMYTISDLINESKKLRDEKDISGAKEKESLAASKAANLIRDISTEGIEDMSIKQLDLNKHVLDYFNTWIKKEGIIPSQIESTEEDFEDMMSVFTRGIKDAFEEIPPIDASIGIDVEYFKMSLAELEPVTLKIKPEIETPTEEIMGEDIEKGANGWAEKIIDYFRKSTFAGRRIIPEAEHGISRVPETGLYKLHKDESVLTKKETSQNVENKNWNINMGGVSLSQNYGFDKFMRDVEEFSLSRL